MRVVVVGLGRIGSLWKRIAIEKGKDDVLTVDPSHTACADYADLTDELLAWAEGVIVCTPTHTHAAIVLRALGAGCTVLCEKPLSLNKHDITECFAAQQWPRQLIVGMNRRWDPFLEPLRDQKPHVVSIDCRDHPVPSPAFLRQSGGVFHDCLVHELDIIENVMGIPIHSILAVHRHAVDDDYKIRDSSFITSATVIMRGVGGESVSVRFCRVSERYVHSVCTHQSLVDIPLPVGAGFQERFENAFENLYWTFKSNKHADRIPTERQLLRLHALCSQMDDALG